MNASWNPPQAASGEARTFGLGAVLLLFLAAVCVVNPLRETPVDDDWAYSETVKHFLDTGHYRLNDWLAPNIAFQTVWAALFCKVAGYSFSTLRVSTIVLAVIGLAAFRALALEHRLNRAAANTLTLCLAASPLFFKLSLTFMSDVPFVATMTLALLFYTRALRLGTWPWWIAASLAGAAAILTRQFGVALLGALALVWLFDDRRIERLGSYAVGAAVPAAATLWQLNRGWNHPTWAAALVLNYQRAYLWGTGFLKNVPWRPFVVVEYLAWFLMPLVLVAAIALVREMRQRRGPRDGPAPAAALAELLAWTVVLVAGVFYAAAVLGLPRWMPFLPYQFELLKLFRGRFRICATVIAVAGGVLFARLFVRRYALPSNRPRGIHEWFLDATAFFSLLLAIVFFLIADEYLLVFLPYAAIVVGKQLEEVLLARRRLVFAASLILLAGTAVWTREDLCRYEAIWSLAERRHASGVPTDKIFAGWEWAGYHHFDDYAREFPLTAFDDFFGRWLAERRARADFLIVHDLQPPGERWEKVDRCSYFSVFSRGTETFYAVRRERDGQVVRLP